ncbi:hypothetical protein K1F50_12695 [Muricauda oceani]|uniref:Uncharacterized protein n=1 Tax=Flagellimonas oceani TaxID=2698672 RepID=A0A6G7J0K1_9FLAO|nr:hypothetical protein [Allomuricauda oceani]MBW8243661.1 hypothetical protein [Allomuricauda oceani]QII43972.1 hypothetical protein GVT53_04560 [Allomuricauda oceani]
MRLNMSETVPLKLLFLMLFVSCNPSNTPEKKFNGADTLAELDDLLLQLNQIDTSNSKKLDEIVTLNEKMRGLIENIRSPKQFDELLKAYNEDLQITFTFSKDKNIGVFSWRTKMGFLGNNIKNIALYKFNNKVIASSLYGESLIYHEIESRIKNNKTVYLLRGTLYQEKKPRPLTINGYAITNGILEESRIPLPENAYVNNTVQ